MMWLAVPRFDTRTVPFPCGGSSVGLSGAPAGTEASVRGKLYLVRSVFATRHHTCWSVSFSPACFVSAPHDKGCLSSCSIRHSACLRMLTRDSPTRAPIEQELKQP